jgi:hypothetical protein
MFKNFKRKFARTTLVLMALQLIGLGLGTGAIDVYADSTVIPAPMVNVDKTDLYEDEVANLTVDLTTPGNYVTVFTTIDGTDYEFIGSYQEGGSHDLDGETNGIFTQEFEYDELIPLLKNGGHIYETTLPLLEDSNLNELFFGSFEVDVKLGYRAPLVSLTPTIIYQNENTDITTKLTAPGNWSTFYATTDGTNFEFVGSYKDGDSDDQDGLPNGVFVGNLDYSDFPVIPATYTTHVYESSTRMHEGDNLLFLSYGVGILQVKQDLNAPTFTFSVAPPKVTDITKSVVLSIFADKQIATTLTGYDIQIETVQGTDVPILQTVDPSVDGISFTSTLSGLKTGDNQTIKVFVTATDTRGNTKTAVYTAADFSFIVDTVAPTAITDIVATIDAEGHVTLSWTNPPIGTYTNLRIVRVGDFSTTLDLAATSFTDLTTEKGKTYLYVLVVGDEAGNETNTPQVTVTVPVAVVVAAAVSDTTNYVAPETNTNTKEEEIKANTDEPAVSTTEEENETEDGFPAWGILILIMLAAVGGYLIWSQQPEQEVTPTVQPSKKSTPTKKK